MTTLLAPDRIFDAINAATDALGMELSREARRRLFAAIDSPGQINWNAARSIVVNERGETLHAVIIRLNGDWYRSAQISSYTILDALERSTK